MCVHAFLPHDAMEKCSLYRLSHLCIMLKQVNIFKICSPSYSHNIVIFPYQTLWQYSNNNPLTIFSTSIWLHPSVIHGAVPDH